MVWGCMLSDGIGHMCRIDGGMDKCLYKEILQDYLKESAEYRGYDMKKMMSQHDNDLKYE